MPNLFEREFAGVPEAVAQKVSGQVEMAVRKAIEAVRNETMEPDILASRVLTCAMALSSAMLLLSAFRRDIRESQTKK